MPFRAFFGKKNSLKRVRTFFVSKFVMKALKVFFYLGLVLNILGALFYGIMFLLSILASIGSSVGFFTFLWENYSSAIMFFFRSGDSVDTCRKFRLRRDERYISFGFRQIDNSGRFMLVRNDNSVLYHRGDNRFGYCRLAKTKCGKRAAIDPR